MDHANLLESLIGLQQEHEVKYCVIGPIAVEMPLARVPAELLKQIPV